MRASPQHRIPHTQSGSESASVYQESEDWEAQGEEEEVEDIGRGEKRRMYLQGLRNLVPELKHAPIDPGQASGHFSLLSVQDKGDKMPFLGELFDQVARSGVKKTTYKQRNVKQKHMFSKLGRLYPTTQPAEGGLLQPRTIPKELRQFVPTNALSESGASGLTAKLKPSTFDGLKEMAASDSYQYATASLRLSNNLEIGVEVGHTLVEESDQHI